MWYVFGLRLNHVFDVKKSVCLFLKAILILISDGPQTELTQQHYEQATGQLTTHGRLSVFAFMSSVSPERPSVAKRLPRPEQTRQDRTSHFLHPPLVKLPIFTQFALELLCLSVWTTSWWHSEGVGESQAWGRSGQAWVIKSNARPQRRSWYISKGLVKVFEAPRTNYFLKHINKIWYPKYLFSPAVIYSV